MPLSIEPFLPSPRTPFARKLLAGTLDRVLGIRQMSQLYDRFDLEHTQGEEFLAKTLEKMNVDIDGIESIVEALPKTGPVLIAANHPFGGLEGVIMLHAITKVRPDVRVLANVGLSLFPQMKEWSIFTNPLKANNPKNAPSLRACRQHLQQGNALLMFPAGRVGYYHKDRQRIADHDWNRVIAKFAALPNVKYCPVFIHGQNSRLFYRLGRVWYRFRLLMLARELTNKHNAKVGLHTEKCAELEKPLSAMNDKEGASFCRALSYIHHPDFRQDWPITEATEFKPLAQPQSAEALLSEVAQLPETQRLYTQSSLSAYFASGEQIPTIVKEIARRRELVFRMHNEGSGEALDTDKFDMAYTHLFVIDNQSGEIAGAYRMGQTDRLQAQQGKDGLYLSQMFNFGDDFVNQKRPCLEMGRSFLMPEYQKSRLGLFMLWRAIGEFVVRFPQYSTLYGTVSLSKLYDKRSIKLIEKLAITPTKSVKPHANFEFTLSPEVERHLNQFPIAPSQSIPILDTWLSFIESDQKKLPVLLRQYSSLGAVFHCLGVDKNFAETPGLLLSVDLTKAPEKRLKQFLGPNWQKIHQ
jgi:putative hemolysin